MCTDGRSLPRARRHRANNPQGSSSNGCCLLRFYHDDGPISFPTTPILFIEMQCPRRPSGLVGNLHIHHLLVSAEVVSSILTSRICVLSFFRNGKRGNVSK